MKINPHIFRAYDIRGIYGEDLTEELFQKIGFVLGKKRGKFLVGNDIRDSGKSLSEALMEGLSKARAEVIYGGTGSFGQILFSGFYLKTDKTLFVTASHLPPQWNGLKIYFGDGEPFSKETLERLRNEVIEIEDEKIDFPKIKVKEANFKKEYIENLLTKFPLIKNNNLKVVLDCGNGSVSFVAPEVFRSFGFKTIELFCKVDSTFPGRSPEPTFEATRILREKVIKEKADFGVAFDGDGDRGVIIDDKGRYLGGNQVGIILGKDILKNSKEKKVIKTVACSMSIEDELSLLGGEFIEVPVGHTYVISNCKKHNAKIGIEESGHIVMPEYFLFDDAILIPLKIAEIVLKEKKKLSELLEKIKIYPFEEITFQCPDEIKFRVAESLTKEFEKEYKKVNTLDGVKVEFDEGWILIRPSNT
ncbi:phosphomannomutase, partial [bacterium]|nr:phosphomannomutase [bacterium]